MSKIFCKILNNKLLEQIEENNILFITQSGFIKGQECVAQATAFIEIMQRRKKENKSTFVIFLDLKKAFDHVNHKLLFEKLENYNINPYIINFIKKLYKNSKACIRINSHFTEFFPMEKGVRQGCPLSPTLFNLFINDFLDDIKGIKIPGLNEKIPGLQYADDTVIFVETEEEINETIGKIEKWCNNNKMFINVKKSGLMLINFNKILTKNFKIFGEELLVVKKYEYLGIEINNEINIDKMALHMIKSGNKLFNIKKSFLLNTNMNLKYKQMLIKNVLYLTLTYGTEIFGINKKRTKNSNKF